MSSAQESIWTTEVLPTGQRRENLNKSESTIWTLVRGFVVGSLLGGIALALVITLWLTTPLVTPTSTKGFSSSSTTSQTTTSTTTTSTTSTSTTTTTTPMAPCVPVSVGSSSIIYNASSGSFSSYVCQAFLWTSNLTGSVNLTFQFQNRPLYWLMDDVLVHDGNTSVIINGGFESGTLYRWFRTDPYGPCGGSDGRVDTQLPLAGSFHLLDGSDNCPDFLTQSFAVVFERIYTISFWLKAGATGSDITVLVTLF